MKTDIKGKMQEYLMLREEIMFLFKEISNYYSLTYTITITVFGFAIPLLKNAKEIANVYPYIFLLPLIIILTSINKIQRNQMQIVKISAYIIVFLEKDTGIYWESIHHEREKTPIDKGFPIKLHSFSLWILLLLCIMLWIVSYILLNSRWTVMFLSALIFIPCFLYDKKFDNWTR